MDTARLRTEHREIAAMARELIVTVERPTPPDPLSFLRFRREFGLALTRHLMHEEWAVYPALLNHRDSETRALAQSIARETSEFGQAIAAYARDWTASRIAAEWEEFRRITKAMMKRLLERIEIEDNRLYPLAASAASDSVPRPMRRLG